MEKAPSLRLFYALWPDASTRTALQALQRALPLSGRPVPAENLHITLAFLGEQSEAHRPLLESILKDLPCPELQLTLDRLGYFKGSRIAWVGMREAPSELMNLQAGLRLALKQAGIAFDAGGKFVPHVTLARSASPLPDVPFEPLHWNTTQLVLVRSLLGPGGSRYEVIASR